MTTPPTPAQRPDPEKPRGAADFETFAALLRRLGPVVGSLAILACTAPAIAGFALFSGSLVKPDAIRSFLDSLGVGAPYAGAALFAVLTGCALAPTWAFSFASGAIFHSFPLAGGIAMFGVTAGAVIGYALATLLARKRVMQTIDEHERARIIRKALLDRGILTETFIITLIRVPPNSPFALTNFTLAAARANPIAYVVGTFIGIAPRTLFAVWLGVQAGDLTTIGGPPKAFVIGGIVVAVVVFLVLYRLFTGWAREALARQLGTEQGADPE
jgi:uncharacterized membrane protein YdjX (TVP38/TMEM64 family)